jgi:tetratricopeptide (TPR) repeat protein
MNQWIYRLGLGRLMLYLLIGLFFCSCITLGSRTKPNPQLAAQYIERARNFEKKGMLPNALEQYKLALTVDPKNETAKKNHRRLSIYLKRLADERYKLGMKYYRIGKYGLARKEFLTALKFNPDHKSASKMLVSRQPRKTPKYVYHVIQAGESLASIAKKYYGDYKKYELIARFNQLKDATNVKPGQRIMIPDAKGMQIPTRSPGKKGGSRSYVLHKIKPGESISKLAQSYYGDYKRFHAIAQFNGMDDATRVSVGQKVKVPRLEGLPFHIPGKAQEATESTNAGSKRSPIHDSLQDLQDQPTQGGKETDEQIMAYRAAAIELYNDARYDDAIFELHKVIEAAPNDQETRTYLGRAYFESGKRHFQAEDFDAARESFESALQYNPQCEQCQAYIAKSKLGPLLAHRTKGIEAFQKNDFLTAILELDEYLKQKPADKEIRVYLSKAYLQQALINYDKGDFLKAKKGFDSALEYDSKCEKCAAYRDKSIQSYQERHYNRGIVYFGKEQLAEAIAEWERVHKIDPDYKDVDQNLKKARGLLEKLEKIKQSQQ